MKHPFIRLSAALLAMCLLLTAFGFVLYTQGMQSVTADEQRRQTIMADGIEQTLDLLEEQIRESSTSFRSRLRASATLMSHALRGQVKGGVYTGPETFPNGMVVRMENGEVIYPASAPKNVDLSTTIFSDDAELFSTLLTESDTGVQKSVMAIARSMADSYYYTGWRTQEDMRRYILAHVALEDVLEAAEDVYNGLLVFVDTQDETLPFLWKSPDLEDVENGASIGLTKEMLKEETGSFEANDTTYLWLRRESEELGSTILFLRPASSHGNVSSSWMTAILVIASLLLLAVIVWFCAVLGLVRNRLLTPPEHRRYAPKRMRKVIGVIGVFGVLLIFSCAALIQALGNLQADTESAETTLNIIYSRIQEEQNQLETARESEENWVLYDAQRLAGMLSDYPELRDQESFQLFSKSLNLQYLMLYDNEGNEMVCSGDFVNLSLGTDPEDPTTDFRRLLHGVQTIIHPTAWIESTDLTSQLVGIRVSLDEAGTYGALLFALPDDAITDLNKFDESSILMEMTPPSALSFSVDLESGQIVSASTSSLKGVSAERLGLALDLPGEGILGTVTWNGQKYNATSIREAGRLYVYLSGNGDEGADILPYAMTAGGCFALVYLLLAVLLLYGYTKTNYEETAIVGTSVAHGDSVEVETPDGSYKHSVDPSKRWAFIYTFWWNKTPAEKARRAVEWVIFLYAVIFFLTQRGQDSLFSTSVFAYLLSGRWTPGFNIFALTAIVLLIVALMVGLMVLRFIISLINNVLGTKGETVCRLLLNFLEYAAALSFLFYAFGYLGFDTSALVASLSLVTLAVSLGSRDLVTDILAGISIVFEGEYQVGDVVDIGGYKGRVQEIGIRSTKLIGDGGNIKIISNRDVKNVLNMTRLNSWNSMELTIQLDRPLEEIEQILRTEFPKIGANSKEIISGPYYKGITAIAPGKVTIAISAECREENLAKVRQIMNREIYDLFNDKQLHLA